MIVSNLSRCLLVSSLLTVCLRNLIQSLNFGAALGPVSTAACIHLGAAVPNFAYLEDNFSVESMHSQWDSRVSTPSSIH